MSGARETTAWPTVAPLARVALARGLLVAIFFPGVLAGYQLLRGANPLVESVAFGLTLGLSTALVTWLEERLARDPRPGRRALGGAVMGLVAGACGAVAMLHMVYASGVAGAGSPEDGLAAIVETPASTLRLWVGSGVVLWGGPWGLLASIRLSPESPAARRVRGLVVFACLALTLGLFVVALGFVMLLRLIGAPRAEEP